MRRPDIQLSDDVASYVERHPEMIALLAGHAAGTPGDGDSAALAAKRRRFGAYVNDRLAFARTGEAAAAGDAYLARLHA